MQKLVSGFKFQVSGLRLNALFKMNSINRLYSNVVMSTASHKDTATQRFTTPKLVTYDFSGRFKAQTQMALVLSAVLVVETVRVVGFSYKGDLQFIMLI